MSKLGYYILTFLCGLIGILSLLSLIPGWDQSDYGAYHRTAQLAELSLQLFITVPIAVLGLLLAMYFARQAQRTRRW